MNLRCLLNRTVFALAALLGVSSVSAQTSEYYLTSWDRIFVYRNGALQRSWAGAVGIGEHAISVIDTVRTYAQNQGNIGAEYSLVGADLGPRYTHNAPVSTMSDATTDGSFNYGIDWNGSVWRFNLNWSSPQQIFTISGSWVGITYDRTDNTLWVSQLNSSPAFVQHRTMGGGLLSSWSVPHDGKGCLALDPADNTLWMRHSNDGQFEQYTKSGTLLQTLSLPGMGGQNALGGEFRFANPADCNSNGYADASEVAAGTSPDCNSNAVPDTCDITEATSGDCNSNGTPDDCETDCNANNVPDDCDIAGPTSTDCNANSIPDTCDSPDCNANGLPDGCDLAGPTSDDCDASGVPDECEGPTGNILWIGPDGASFGDPSNWSPAGVPSGGGTAQLLNTGALDNRCVLSSPGTTGVCDASISATGAGRQLLQINAGSTLQTGSGVSVDMGGELLLQGGTVCGGAVTNLSNTVRGFGQLAADMDNAGLIEARPGLDHVLLINGSSFSNQADGALTSLIGALVLVESGAVQQAGSILVRPLSGVVFDAAMANASGGSIVLYGGTIGSYAVGGITNEIGAAIDGAGTIDANLTNDGEMSIIADTLVAGDLNNDGTITIQSGILTVAGSLSGAGTIIGGFGGRGGGAADNGLADAGLSIRGDFDLAVGDYHQIDLTDALVQMAGDPADGVQTLEALAMDRSFRSIALSDVSLFLIDTLRIGPTPTVVRLVDRHVNSGSNRRSPGDHEVLYVQHLVLDPGVTLDLAGLNLYCESIFLVESRASGERAKIIDSVGGGGLLPLNRESESDRRAPAAN